MSSPLTSSIPSASLSANSSSNPEPNGTNSSGNEKAPTSGQPFSATGFFSNIRSSAVTTIVDAANKVGGFFERSVTCIKNIPASISSLFSRVADSIGSWAMTFADSLCMAVRGTGSAKNAAKGELETGDVLGAGEGAGGSSSSEKNEVRQPINVSTNNNENALVVDQSLIAKDGGNGNQDGLAGGEDQQSVSSLSNNDVPPGGEDKAAIKEHEAGIQGNKAQVQGVAVPTEMLPSRSDMDPDFIQRAASFNSVGSITSNSENSHRSGNCSIRGREHSTNSRNSSSSSSWFLAGSESQYSLGDPE